MNDSDLHIQVEAYSGYSYEEWLNDFYPANTPASQMLPYYAQTISQ